MTVQPLTKRPRSSFKTIDLGSKTCFRKGFKNVDDVAEIVKNIILSDKPNLRYLTNEKYNVDVSSKGQTF